MEDYYVVNKLMKGFFGSVNIDINLWFCMLFVVVVYKWVFGEDVVLGCYEDLELVDLMILIGFNIVWCYLILFQCIKVAKE